VLFLSVFQCFCEFNLCRLSTLVALGEASFAKSPFLFLLDNVDVLVPDRLLLFR
jgi:hypothetical protein